jgi:branched-chain amino acid transport system ATP-binding protein
MLEVKNIETVYFDRLYILKGLSLKVNKGEIRVVIGPNGTGKTTLLKSIMGLIKDQPRKGEIIFNGKNITRKDPEEIAQSGITLVPEDRGVFPELKVKENLILAGWTGEKDHEIFDVFPNLKNKLNELANNLSGGEQQMLALARAILKKPKLILLDEPSLGLSPKIITELFSILKNLNEKMKITILIAEQNVKAATSIAHYGYVMEEGKIVFEGTPEDFQNNELVKELYLGGSIKKPEKGWQLYKRKRRW